MPILDDLLAALPQDAPVRDVLVSAHWTVVCSLGCGFASTMPRRGRHELAPVKEAGRLLEKSARELAELARSDSPLEAGIGVAAINSLLRVDLRGAVEANAADIIVERGRGRKVALVGHFPFIERVRPALGRLWVIEHDPAPGEYPSEAAASLIPQADLVALTGSAIVNHTLDGLIALCRPGADVMVLGPSTPLSPVLFDHGVTIACGALVLDEAAVMRSVSQGGSFQQVGGVRRITLMR
jgi:uncharacterized protein